jgi:hypothetical protein
MEDTFNKCTGIGSEDGITTRSSKGPAKPSTCSSRTRSIPTNNTRLIAEHEANMNTDNIDIMVPCMRKTHQELDRVLGYLQLESRKGEGLW